MEAAAESHASRCAPARALLQSWAHGSPCHRARSQRDGRSRRGAQHARRRRLRPRGLPDGRPTSPPGAAARPSMSGPPRIFLLSPAHCGGERAALLFRKEADFDLARRVRTPPGVPLGEVFSFLSGLYFRGKLAYAEAFAAPPASTWTPPPGRSGIAFASRPTSSAGAT